MSAVAIISILYFLSRWMEPSTITDTSSVVMMDEPFTFNNIKEKFVETVTNSKSCDELKYNLDEYKRFVENYGIEKGYRINFQYRFLVSCSDNPPTSGTIEFMLNITTPKAEIGSVFQSIWSP